MVCTIEVNAWLHLRGQNWWQSYMCLGQRLHLHPPTIHVTVFEIQEQHSLYTDIRCLLRLKKCILSPQNNVKIMPIAEDTPPVFGQAADQDKICNLKPGQITFLVSRKSRKTFQCVVISVVWEGTGLENLGRDKSTGLFGPGNKSNII